MVSKNRSGVGCDIGNRIISAVSRGATPVECFNAQADG
jgi:hypothetical protein